MSTLKTIGSSGQISLGKNYAGRKVLIEEIEPGVWLVKTGEFVPDNEKWLHTPEAAAEITRAIEWAKTHPPKASSVKALAKRVKQ